MTGNYISNVDQASRKRLFVHCPTTGERMETEQLDVIEYEDRTVIWWRCPACGDWHLLHTYRDHPTRPK